MGDIQFLFHALEKGVVELTCRRTGETEEVSPQAATDRIYQIYQGV